MPYSNVTNPMMQPPSNNNWWFGNNYSSGYSQANRSAIPQPQVYLQPYQPTPQPQEPQTMNNIIQAMGPESAEEFKVGPNSHVIIMDSYRPVFYMKDSDDTGHAKTRAFEFHEIPLHQPQHYSPEAQLTKDDIVEIVKSTIEPWQKSIEELVTNNG